MDCPRRFTSLRSLLTYPVPARRASGCVCGRHRARAVQARPRRPGARHAVVRLLARGSRRERCRAVDALWNLIALPTVNLPAERASLAMAAKVFQTGLLDSADAGDVGYSRVPLSQAARRARRARAARGRGGRAGEDARARDPGGNRGGVGRRLAARRRRGGGRAARPRGRAAARGRGQRADRAARQLADRQRPRDLRPPRHRPRRWPPDSTRRCSGSSTARRRPASAKGQHLALSLSGADREMAMSNEELPPRADARAGRSSCLRRATRWWRISSWCASTQQPSAPSRAPGALRPGPRTSVPGLFLAGAWTDTGWPATMEGAVRSGHAAARELLASLGDRTPAMVHAA